MSDEFSKVEVNHRRRPQAALQHRVSLTLRPETARLRSSSPCRVPPIAMGRGASSSREAIEGSKAS